MVFKRGTRKGGTNITGFQDPEVDALIEKQKKIFEVQKRNAIYRKIDTLVYRAFPYVLLWNIDYVRLLYWNQFGMPPTVLSKYGDERSAYDYWWLDPDSAADLKDAMENDIPMPPRPLEVRFDAVFPGKTIQTPSVQ